MSQSEVLDLFVATGDAYFEGSGVAKDYCAAMSYYKLAAEHGNEVGIWNVGRMCENGFGVAKDLNEAIKWYRRAAELGFPPSQLALGLLLSAGSGLSPDLVQAYHWFLRAAEQGLHSYRIIYQAVLGEFFQEMSNLPLLIKCLLRRATQELLDVIRKCLS